MRITDFEGISDIVFFKGLGLPLEVTCLSKYKAIRVIGLLAMFPWLIIFGFPIGVLWLFFSFLDVVKNI